ncbi:HAD-IA family hydrolase [Glycomyces rhizosphaerae]|uniref:HAD-IA family hydrolase n=1 Tax=Glycomyces rhizosphaerae TaxID=2054422 RepID=A0ABV7Q257_9ACTN
MLQAGAPDPGSARREVPASRDRTPVEAIVLELFGVIIAFDDDVVPMPGMADLVGSLSERFRLVLLSNVDHCYWRTVQERHPELQDITKLPVSCDLGLAKPEPEAFLLASRAAGADPARCLFVDDTRVNAEAAQALGFQTHLYRDVPGFRETLRHRDIARYPDTPLGRCEHRTAPRVFTC